MSADASCRLITTPMFDADPPALRVTRIAWDSGFRGTALRVGDQIVAINGAVITRPGDPQALARATQTAIGSYGEAQVWSAAGLGEGASVTLGLRRRKVPGVGWETLEATGTLKSEASWRDDQNQPLLGPAGPPQNYAADGFDSSWGEWTEREVQTEFAKALDDPRYALAQTTRYLLQQHQARQARVDLLVAKYPGPFAAAVKADSDAVMARLQGEPIAMPPGALNFRREEAEHVAEVSKAADAAWTSMQTALAGTLIPAFPAIDPSRQDRTPVVGKHVVVGPLHNEDWITDSGRGWFVAGDENQGFHFLDAESPEVEAVLRAMQRYRRQVVPNIESAFEFIAQILDAPRLGVINGRAHFGLQLKLRAARVGSALFVDLSNFTGGEAAFAGEAGIAQSQTPLPQPDASPAEVMTAFVTAVKEGNLALWKQLFSNWRIEYLEDRRPLLYPQPMQASGDRFEDARRLILGKVVDVRPLWTGDPRTVIAGGDYAGALTLEEVDVQMQHIGEFDGGYRAFSDVTVTDFWTLQRVNGGPWRIADADVL